MSNGSSFVRAQNGKLIAGSYDSLKAVLWADESIENARLIALAPDMAETLRKIADPFGFPVSLTAEERRIQDQRLARALLAKLEGGAS